VGVIWDGVEHQMDRQGRSEDEGEEYRRGSQACKISGGKRVEG